MNKDIQNRKSTWLTVIPVAFGKKIQWTLAQKLQRSKGQIVPTQIDFLENHISAPKGCCAPRFLHVLENGQVLLAHTPTEMGVLLTIF